MLSSVEYLNILALVFSGLVAGLFFAWEVSVIVGLTTVSDQSLIETMQKINKAIQNLLFLSVFLGTGIILPICTYITFHEHSSWNTLLLVASIMYLTGVIGITVLGNIPLNNRLDAFVLDGASAGEIAGARKKYEAPWNRLNRIRTIAAIIVFILVVVAVVGLDKQVI